MHPVSPLHLGPLVGHHLVCKGSSSAGWLVGRLFVLIHADVVGPLELLAAVGHHLLALHEFGVCSLKGLESVLVVQVGLVLIIEVLLLAFAGLTFTQGDVLVHVFNLGDQSFGVVVVGGHGGKAWSHFTR